MPFDAFRFKVFTRRVFIVSALQAFAFVVIIIRLFKFQILDYSYFKDKSDGNRIKSTIIPPLRGLILDRDGKIVASNTEYYRVILKKTNYRTDLEQIEKLARVLGFEKEGKRNLMIEYNKNRIQKEIIIYRYLTRKELLKIEFNLHLLKNISVGIGYARVYSNPYAFSSLLGYVIQVPNSELKKGKNIAHPDIKIGAEGIEKFYNNELIGNYGVQYSEVNVSGFKIADLERIKPVSGKNIRLSFNAKLQAFAYELCNDKKASVVLMDVTTGEVLVMLSNPSFNANLLSKKVDTETWNALLSDVNKPLINRPIQSAYAPGSIFKPITAIVGLEEGMSLNDTIKCTGQIKLYGQIRRCWLKTGHGKMDLHHAIKHSCNIMFYHIATFSNINNFHRIAKQFSFGESFKNFDFQKQNLGINPDDKWKRLEMHEPWYPGDTVNLAIGQGFVRASAMQMAVMFARIASLGKKVEPTLKLWQGTTFPQFEDIAIDKAHILFVKNGLFDATNTRGGTSFYSRIQEKGMEFSGKTGTAQVVSKFLEKHEYTDVNRPHGIFAGFAPFENSKFSACVIVENGGFGSSAAAPIGKNLLYFAQLLNAGRVDDAKRLAKNLGINYDNL